MRRAWEWLHAEEDEQQAFVRVQEGAWWDSSRRHSAADMVRPSVTGAGCKLLELDRGVGDAVHKSVLQVALEGGQGGPVKRLQGLGADATEVSER